MKKLSLSEKQKKYLMVFGAAAFALFMVYCGFMNHSFTSDHVNVFMRGKDSYVRPPLNPLYYVKTGLGLNGLFMWTEYLFAKIGVTKDHNQYVLQIVGILFMSGVVTMLYSLYEKYVKEPYQKILLAVILLVQFVNPYFCEVMLYVAYEKMFGVMAAVLATMLFTKKKYIWAFLFVLLAVTSYQVYFALFLVYTSTWIFLESEETFTRDTFFTYFKLYMTMMVPAILFIGLYLLSTYLGIGAYIGKSIPMDAGFLERLQVVKRKYMEMMVTQQGLLPRYFLVICFVVFGLLLLIFRGRKNGKDMLYGIAHIFVMTLYPVAIYFIAIRTQASGRIIWCIFAALSGVMMGVLVNCRKKDVKFRILIAALALFFCIDIYSVSSTIKNIYVSNALDSQIVSQVVAQIENYERETGISVQNIAASSNPNSRYSYSQVSFLGMDYSNEDAGYYNFTHKAMKDLWADAELFVYLTGRPYNIVEMDPTIWSEHFAGRSWETFNPQEQIYFEGDTIYWCIY